MSIHFIIKAGLPLSRKKRSDGSPHNQLFYNLFSNIYNNLSIKTHIITYKDFNNFWHIGSEYKFIFSLIINRLDRIIPCEM